MSNQPENEKLAASIDTLTKAVCVSTGIIVMTLCMVVASNVGAATGQSNSSINIPIFMLITFFALAFYGTLLLLFRVIKLF